MLVQDDLVLAHGIRDDLPLANLAIKASLHELGDLGNLGVRRIQGLLHEFLAILDAEGVEVPDTFLRVGCEGHVPWLQLVLDPKHHTDALLVGVRIKTLGFLHHLAVEEAVAHVPLLLAVEDLLHEHLEGPEEVQAVEVTLELGQAPDRDPVVQGCTLQRDFVLVEEPCASPAKGPSGLQKGLQVLNDAVLDVPCAVDLVDEVLEFRTAVVLSLSSWGLSNYKLYFVYVGV